MAYNTIIDDYGDKLKRTKRNQIIIGFVSVVFAFLCFISFVWHKSIWDFKDITAVSAGDSHTVGLKSDGTVVTAGVGFGDNIDVKEWTDIISVSAGPYHTVGLKSDGTVVVADSSNE